MAKFLKGSHLEVAEVMQKNSIIGYDYIYALKAKPGEIRSPDLAYEYVADLILEKTQTNSKLLTWVHHEFDIPKSTKVTRDLLVEELKILTDNNESLLIDWCDMIQTAGANEALFLRNIGKEIHGQRMSIMRAQIVEDLNRVPFIETQNHTIKDLFNTWLTVDADNNFVQGGMDATWFRLVQTEFSTLLQNKAREMNVEDEMETVIPEYNMSVRDFMDPGKAKTFAYTYFDDEGIPCGVYVSQVADVGWVASIIRNATGSLEDRECMVWASDSFLPFGKKDNSNTKESFLQCLGSKEIRSIFESHGVFNENEPSIDGISSVLEKYKQVSSIQMKYRELIEENIDKSYNLEDEEFNALITRLVEQKKTDKLGTILTAREQQVQKALDALPQESKKVRKITAEELAKDPDNYRGLITLVGTVLALAAVVTIAIFAWELIAIAVVGLMLAEFAFMALDVGVTSLASMIYMNNLEAEVAETNKAVAVNEEERLALRNSIMHAPFTTEEMDLLENRTQKVEVDTDESISVNDDVAEGFIDDELSGDESGYSSTLSEDMPPETLPKVANVSSTLFAHANPVGDNLNPGMEATI